MSSDGTKQPGNYEEQFQSRLTHVLYCPQCRNELGRFDDVDEASEASYYHHIGHGHNPGLVTGVFRDA